MYNIPPNLSSNSMIMKCQMIDVVFESQYGYGATIIQHPVDWLCILVSLIVDSCLTTVPVGFRFISLSNTTRL